MEQLQKEEAALTLKINALRKQKIMNLYNSVALLNQEIGLRRLRISNLYLQKVELCG